MQSQLLLIAQNILGIFVFFLLCLLIYVNGSWLLRFFRIQLQSRIEEVAFAFGLGFLLTQFITLLLGLFGLLYAAVFQSICAVLLTVLHRRILLALKDLFVFMKEFVTSIFGDIRRGKNLFQILLYLVLFRFAAIYFVGALNPEVESDALTYHLGALRLYVDNNRIFNLENIFHSNFPFGMEMLFLLGWIVQDVFVGKLFNFLMPVLSIIAISAFCRRHLDPKASLLASTIFYSSPAVGLASKSAYVDAALGYATLLTIYALLNFKSTRRNGWIYLSGIYCGLALTIKYTGVNTLILGILVLFIISTTSKESLRIRFGKFAKLAVSVGIIAICIFAPWGLKNLIFTGNPVFPFLSSIFPSVYMSESFEEILMKSINKLKDPNIHFFLTLPWSAKVYSEQSGDWPIGPFYFWVLPLAFFIRNKDSSIKYLLAVGLIGYCVWLFQSPQPRLLLQYCALSSIPAAYVILRFETTRVLGIASKILVLVFLFQIRDPRWDLSIDFLIGKQTREEFLARTFPGYHYINTHLPESAQILALSYPNQFLTSRTIWGQDTSLGGRQLAEDLFFATFNETKLGRMRVRIKPEIQAKYIRLKKIRTDGDFWWLYEVCVVCKNENSGLKYLSGLARANSNFRQERASRAIDFNLATLWDSGETEKIGMSFDLELIQPCLISEITYFSKEWESPDLLNVYLSGDGRNWNRVQHSGDEKFFFLSREMWRDAMRSLYSENIHYLYWEAHPGQGYYPVISALEENEKIFGLEAIYKKDNISLYKIQRLRSRQNIAKLLAE